MHRCVLERQKLAGHGDTVNCKTLLLPQVAMARAFFTAAKNRVLILVFCMCVFGIEVFCYAAVSFYSAGIKQTLNTFTGWKGNRGWKC